MFTELDKLFVELERLDIKLWSEDGRLRFDAPPNVLTPTLREQLQAHKAEILDFLNQAGIHSAKDTLSLGESYIFNPSFAQRHFGLLQKLNPTDCFYNVLTGFELNGNVDISILQQALNAIVTRHDFLRTTLQEINGELMQVVHHGEIAITIVNLQSLSVEAQQQAINNELELEWHSPFNLETDSSLRVRLLCLAENRFVLLFCTHNVLFEGSALRALLHELGSHYADIVENRPCSLPILPMQYADCVRWQQAALMTGMDARLSYWREWFKQGEPPFPTLAKHTAPPISFEGDTLWIDIPVELTQQLKMLSQQTGVTLFSTLLTAYSIVLYQYSGYTDITLGTPFVNRNHWKLEPLIGSMLILVTLRFDLSGNPTYSNLLKKVHQTVVEAFTYQDVPFAAVAPLLHNQQRITPLFRTLFTFFAETPYKQLQLPDIDVNYIDDIHSNVMRPDLYPGMWEKDTPNGTVLRGYWQYKKALFSTEQARAMLNSFQAILKNMASNPTQTLDNL